MVEETEEQICFNCKMPNSIEEDYCFNCGFKLRKKIQKDISRQKANVATRKQKKTIIFLLILLIFITPFATLIIRSNYYDGTVIIINVAYEEADNEFVILFYCENGSSILKSVFLGQGTTSGISYFIEEKYNLKMKDSQVYTITIAYDGVLPDKLYIKYDCFTFGPMIRSYDIS